MISARLTPTSAIESFNGKLTTGLVSSDVVPPAHLRSLKDLLASPYASEVLQSLRSSSDEVISLLHHRMRADHGGRQWEVRRGFHAVPSMEQIHLHVISADLVSDRLKHKKHYQSFHPTHSFWLDLKDAEAYVSSKSLPQPDSYYESLLRSPLVSFRDGQVYATMPQLKQHLEQAWRDELQIAPSSSSVDTAPKGVKRKLPATSSLPRTATGATEKGNVKRKVKAEPRPTQVQDRGSETETEPEA